jgi:hypothetical protein
MLRSLCFAAVLLSVVGNMYDVIEPEKVPPASCKSGCADWSTAGSKFDALWVDGKAPAGAKNLCAQPGKSVDTYNLGSWCPCKKSTKPTPAPTPAKDPDHPLDGKTFTWYNTYSGMENYVSFADTAAPPGMSGGSVDSVWLRSEYSANEAMPIKMFAVKGKKNVYTLQNQWADSEYDHFLHLTDQPGSTYKFMECAGDAKTAGEFEFRLTSGNATDSDADTYNILDNTNSEYISFCTSGCSDGYWIAGDYSGQSSAMPVQLLEHGATPGGEWGYW